MKKIDEDVINNMTIVYRSVLKQKYLTSPSKGLKATYHFSVLPDYQEAMLEAKKEKPISNEFVKNAKSTKVDKRWVSLTFLIINILVVVGIFVYQFTTGEVVSLVELFKLAPYYRYLFLSLGIFFLINVLDALKFGNLIRRSTGHVRPFLSYKTQALGKYYDCITPLNTGGQPFQMVYLKKNSIKGDVASAIPFVKFFLWQVAWNIICFSILIFNGGNYVGNSHIVQIIAWISLALNFSLLSLIITLSISKRIAPRIVMWILKLARKLHIIKDSKETFKKVFRLVAGYQESFKLLSKNWFQALYHIVLNGATIILNCSLGYFIYLAFNIDGGFGFWEIVTSFLICELATGLVPLPGAAGAAEISFAAVFAKYFAKNTLVWAMLFWRIFTYFAYIIQGVTIVIYDYAYGSKKAVYYNKVGRFSGNKNYTRYRHLTDEEKKQFK